MYGAYRLSGEFCGGRRARACGVNGRRFGGGTIVSHFDVEGWMISTIYVLATFPGSEEYELYRCGYGEGVAAAVGT